jgi:ABC-type transport system substrate-binding protein
VALAIDRERLVGGPLGGYAEIVDQVVAPAVFGYDATLAPLAHDPGEARRLLANAGVAPGVSLDLDFMPSKYRAMDAVVSGLASDLRSVGVEARPRPWEAADFIARIERHDPVLFLWGWMSTGGDANVSYDYLLRSPRNGFGIDNGGAYSSPEVDRLLEQATHELDPLRRKERLAAVARRIQGDAAVVPLYRQTDLYGVARDLEFHPRVDRRIRGAHLRWRTS